MSIIYEPKGKAREYSPLAANYYDGCDHGCKYCYAPRIRYKTREEYRQVKPRRDILNQLEKDCKKYAYSTRQVLFNFMGDPYCKANNEHKLTRGSLKLLLEYHIPVAVLTKGGERALQDIDIIKKFGKHAKVGATLTFDSTEKSKEWEPGAAVPEHRYEMLREFHNAGIKTWASFEPVIDPSESLKAITKSLPFVDEYKIGKINKFESMDKTIDWKAFLKEVVFILRGNDKPFYIKYDLRQAAPYVKLYGNEVLEDEFNLPAFEKRELF